MAADASPNDIGNCYGPLLGICFQYSELDQSCTSVSNLNSTNLSHDSFDLIDGSRNGVKLSRLEPGPLFFSDGLV